MQETIKPLLFDRDNLKQIFGDRRNKELLKKHGYKTTEDLFQSLIDHGSLGAEYIIGLPGVGKTTFVLQCMGAQMIKTKEDIHALLTLQFDTMVFVTSDVEDRIAKNASRITLLHTSSERLGLQRQQRDEDIQEGESETAFGRQAGSVAKVTTDASILISRLKTDYQNKSRIVVYKNNNPDNWDEKKDIPVSNLSDKRKYVEEGVIAASGKWAPAQIVHIEHQLKKVLSLAQEKGFASFAIIGQNSGGAYDLGLTQRERSKIINLVLDEKLQFITVGTPKFVKDDEGKVIKIIPEKSRAVLGKERLPVGFAAGSYQELLDAYPEFFKHKDAYAVKSFAGYNFINIGNVSMEGSDESISATFIRKCLVEGNVNAIQPYLSPEIFSALTSPHNLQSLQRRYLLIQERDQKIKKIKEALITRYKHVHPLTHIPLGVNKKSEPIILSKKHADLCEKRSDQAKIMTYLQNINQMLKDAERKIKKEYAKLIYTPENKLNFDD
ncbi:MAG: hypothetical protein WC606_02815 [Candidatus Absconditabacterales bacterium]